MLDIFSQDSVLCYKFLLKNNIIGFCNVLQNASSIFLFGICIKKRVQNQGYGGIMMKFLLNDLLLLKKSITLQVNSLNIPALHLYQRLGFSSTICFDSYSIENKCF
ncbi:GNAT family N-acetyltransferase [uncultured Clostridium sp.]|uniref:GNAT family N-acetyltransferase n=1 Tax=uncultured Clostridium sp. TaxID=59620 RepID=UPI0034574D30